MFFDRFVHSLVLIDLYGLISDRPPFMVLNVYCGFSGNSVKCALRLGSAVDMIHFSKVQIKSDYNVETLEDFINLKYRSYICRSGVFDCELNHSKVFCHRFSWDRKYQPFVPLLNSMNYYFQCNSMYNILQNWKNVAHLSGISPFPDGSTGSSFL